MYIFCDILNDWVYLVDMIDDCENCQFHESCRDFNIVEFTEVEKLILKEVD